ncbi:hypothetical protein PAPYR_5222 [Paratrimastix pyriformis]|uniref:Uncharacterized protein n=1 Tax=Paratrimastix pyriformis TaxID=342808 RepID=A0ABQ8UI92_9EUKA|nr:hypothetical protein PAPYR_5222 [Paratrimastix pyriformis]
MPSYWRDWVWSASDVMHNHWISGNILPAHSLWGGGEKKDLWQQMHLPEKVRKVETENSCGEFALPRFQ